MKLKNQLVCLVGIMMAGQALAQSTVTTKADAAPLTGIKSVELKNGPLSDFYDLIAPSKRQANESFVSQGSEKSKKDRTEKDDGNVVASAEKSTERNLAAHLPQ